MVGVSAVIAAIAVTLIAALLNIISYGHHRKQAMRFWERELKLPDATRYDNLQLRVEESQAELDRFQDQLFDARQIIEEAERQKRWLEETREEVANLEHDRNELMRIQTELESLQTQLAELTQLRVELEANISELKAKQQEYEQASAQLDSQLKLLGETKEEISKTEERLRSLQQDQVNEEEKLEKIKKKAEGIREELQKGLRELSAEKHEAKSELEKLDSRIDDLLDEEKELQERNRELSGEVNALEAKTNALSSQMPVLQSAFDSLSEKLNPGSSQANDTQDSDIWLPVLVGSASQSNASTSEIDALSSLRKHLEYEGLRFHERTINAFHTALKTTDSSPLVVLAGVSGTGKSELPRRYAEAMGLNFLNMAVQPRWDSPQDLFGFYDYLEQKFRPTELTRALIQMDGIQNRGERGWRPPQTFAENSRSDGVLLVLLDEMNLARVEYYFSEFLSRLETRRGVDVSNDAERRRAEIVLEVSGRQSGDPPMQLFVDRNVIFVGTMNEDETTQSLSDKVIDRANVLRFGSPNSVASVHKKTAKNGKAVSTNWKLSKEHWFDWQRNSDELDSDERDRILEWIAKLRKSLDEVRRPFAYRVAKSMLEYAANYPRVENRLEKVIADQIEQKVLPRLRGLDPYDREAQAVFNTIYKILEDAGDDVLIEEIKACCRDHYFQWGGLDRYEESVVR